jgi:hypothetical protein
MAREVRVGTLEQPKENIHLRLVEGVGLDITPISSFEMLVFQESAQRLIDDLRTGVDACMDAGIVLKESFDINNQAHVNALYREALTKEMAAAKIVSWTGFKDMAGNDLPLTPDNARRVMDIYIIANAFFDKVTQAHVEMTFAKKECGAGSDGLPDPAPITAGDAVFTKPPVPVESAA